MRQQKYRQLSKDWYKAYMDTVEVKQIQSAKIWQNTEVVQSSRWVLTVLVLQPGGYEELLCICGWRRSEAGVTWWRRSLGEFCWSKCVRWKWRCSTLTIKSWKVRTERVVIGTVRVRVRVLKLHPHPGPHWPLQVAPLSSADFGPVWLESVPPVPHLPPW